MGVGGGKSRTVAASSDVKRPAHSASARCVGSRSQEGALAGHTCLRSAGRITLLKLMAGWCQHASWDCPLAE